MWFAANYFKFEQPHVLEALVSTCVGCNGAQALTAEPAQKGLPTTKRDKDSNSAVVRGTEQETCDTRQGLARVLATYHGDFSQLT